MAGERRVRDGVSPSDVLRRSVRARRVPVVAAAVLVALFVALGVAVALPWSALVGTDAAVDGAVHVVVLADPTLLSATLIITVLGSPLSVDVVTAAVAVAAGITRRWAVAGYLVVVRVVELGVETAAKNVVGRPRPALPDPVADASSFSFPSGHTAGTAALAAALLVVALPLVRRRWRVTMVVLLGGFTLAVAASRVLLGVHYPSDVLAGIALGVACALGLAPFLELRRSCGSRAHDPPG